MEKYERLQALLPPLDSQYDYHRLSQAETAAFIEAMRDGFGAVGARDSTPHSLPKNIKQGLLDHSIHFRKASSCVDDDEDGWDYEFWTSHTDVPAPAEEFPLGFELRALRIYFDHQVRRYCDRIIRENPEAYTHGADSEDIWMIQERGRMRLYEKPWYELHAIELFVGIGECAKYLSDSPGLMSLTLARLCGQLGRLVEQYSWRFRYEDAALAGTAARKGASSGGRARAGRHGAEQAKWQNAALDIWARRPELSKIAVAELIKRQVRAAPTAKHIARHIVRR
jgi:hypothetical protein